MVNGRQYEGTGQNKKDAKQAMAADFIGYHQSQELAQKVQKFAVIPSTIILSNLKCQCRLWNAYSNFNAFLTIPQIKVSVKL